MAGSESGGVSVTPNFSWPLIEPTDFVTNLPADLETLADDIDSDVWAIKGTADAALPETLIDAAGDLIYGSAADTAARLAIGTAGQVLTVNSGATAPEWGSVAADSYTLLASGSMPAANNLALTSISQSYRDLILVVEDVTQATTNERLDLRINNNSSGIYAHIPTTTGNSAATNTVAEISSSQIYQATTDAFFIITFYDYANTTSYKVMESRFCFQTSTTPQFSVGQQTLIARTTSAISEINLLTGTGGNWSAGSYRLYGRK